MIFFFIPFLLIIAETTMDCYPPPEFVYLRDVEPSILQEIRYSGFHNFVGKPINGYYASECLLTIPAAEGLARVQKELLKENLSLKVYDCYRPQKAVDQFFQWSLNDSDTLMKEEFYSDLDKSVLFDLGYIAKKSGHCRGSTVDLTIVELPPKKQPSYNPGEQLTPCMAPLGKRFLDNSIDMGTGFDCFNTLANTDDPRIQGIPKANRQKLKSLMEKNNFKNLDVEWWHYTLNNEPFPYTSFDFDILPK